MKYVLVTGAGGGMGYEAVKCLKKAGYHVFALDINPPKAEQDVTPVKADLTFYNLPLRCLN